jgi:O-antigen ligase
VYALRCPANFASGNTSIVDRFGFFLLAASVAIAPIPFGSNSAGWAGCLGLLLCISLLATTAVPQANRAITRLYGTALLLGVVLVVCAVVQVTPWGYPVWTDTIWVKVSRFIGESDGIISASRYQPLHSTGYALLAIAAFICALVYVRDGSRYMAFAHALLVTGTAATLFCIGQSYLSPDWLLWAEKKHYVGSFTGTFVNPNTAATYLGLMLLLSGSTAVHQLEDVKVRRLFLAQSRWSAHERRQMRSFLVYAALAFVFVVALLLTRSRGGILSSLIGVAVFSAVYLFSTLRRSRSALVSAALTASALLVGAVGFVAYSGGLLRRLEIEGLTDEARLCVYGATWRAITDNFWGGTGLGTFQDILTSYRQPECKLYGYWDMAHNVFLEGWLGLGVVFLGCMAVTYYGLLHSYIHGMRERHRFRFVPLLSLCLLLAVSLHSLVDFSLQIPGVAIPVAAALGAGCAISLGRRID